jgi:hypothetical protein
MKWCSDREATFLFPYLILSLVRRVNVYFFVSESATSTQSLLIIRCCGSLLPEASPNIRTQLVEEIWKTLENIGICT